MEFEPGINGRDGGLLLLNRILVPRGGEMSMHVGLPLGNQKVSIPPTDVAGWILQQDVQ